MRKVGTFKWVWGCLLLLMIIGVGGCRGIGSEPTRERLEARVEGFVKARNAMNRTEMAKFYLEPDKARVGNIHFQDGEIKEIKVTGEKAEVVLLNTFQVMGFTFKKVPQKTNWVWQRGDWYLTVPQNTSPFQTQKPGAGKK